MAAEARPRRGPQQPLHPQPYRKVVGGAAPAALRGRGGGEGDSSVGPFGHEGLYF